MPTKSKSSPRKSTRLKPAKGAVGRPRRAPGLKRRQIVVDTALLEAAMKFTGKNQSETVNDALARMAESAHILEGLESIYGMFPDHPDHENGD